MFIFLLNIFRNREFVDYICDSFWRYCVMDFGDSIIVKLRNNKVNFKYIIYICSIYNSFCCYKILNMYVK